MEKNFASLILFFGFFLSCFFLQACAQNVTDQVTVNGDKVEYSTDNKTIKATGNVSILYRGSKLSCDSLTLDSQNKDAFGEGHIRLDDPKAVIEGRSIKYNLQKKAGTVFDAKFRSDKLFGQANELEKVNDSLYLGSRGYFTTCNNDPPHFRFKTKKVYFRPNDSIEARNIGMFAGQNAQIPLLYLPKYKHSFKDPIMHVQVSPGKNKRWGPYLLTAWRYNLTDNLSGRIYADYRSKLGVAEGFGTNYKSSDFGRGDFKFYYTQERPQDIEEGKPAEFERYFVRVRHKWDLDARTNLTSEYYKIVDSKRALYGTEFNVLKDYFPREYEKDSMPLSYSQLHRAFDYSSADILVQKRTNRWYSQWEKLPEAKYSLPTVQIASTPFFFENNLSAAEYNYKNSVPSPSTSDIEVGRVDTKNKLSLPMKIAFISFTPFTAVEETYYSRNVFDSSIHPRTVFFTGADVSTKFYRLFDVRTNALGLDINGIRHIVTPSIGYAYNHEPTIPGSKLVQVDAIDAINVSNAANLELSNKFQTKRNGLSVDFTDFRINSSYVFKPKTAVKYGSSFSDVLFDLTFLPNSWIRFDSESTYKHSGLRTDPNYEKFSNINNDITFNLKKGTSFGAGERYQRKGGHQLTYNYNWYLNPKWKCSLYNRYEVGHDPALRTGLREQEYSIARDLHCWIWDVRYNVKRNEGETIWFVFTLKAFPEAMFGFDQSYHSPKTGSQGYHN